MITIRQVTLILLSCMMLQMIIFGISIGYELGIFKKDMYMETVLMSRPQSGSYFDQSNLPPAEPRIEVIIYYIIGIISLYCVCKYVGKLTLQKNKYPANHDTSMTIVSCKNCNKISVLEAENNCSYCHSTEIEKQ